MAADTTYRPKVYKRSGGDKITVASGGEIEVEAGGLLNMGGPVAAGSALTVTRLLHHGRIIALDTAAGSTCTLPAATGTGSRFTFIVTVTPTSNAHVVAAYTTDIMAGLALGLDDDGVPANAWGTASDTDKVSMNSSTTGGEIGDMVECVDILTGVWAVQVRLTQSGSEATPFAAT